MNPEYLTHQHISATDFYYLPSIKGSLLHLSLSAIRGPCFISFTAKRGPCVISLTAKRGPCLICLSAKGSLLHLSLNKLVLNSLIAVQCCTLKTANLQAHKARSLVDSGDSFIVL